MMNNKGMQLLQRLQQFKNSYSGNPQQQIQQMLNSGRINQSQYDEAVRQTNELAKMLNIPTH